MSLRFNKLSTPPSLHKRGRIVANILQALGITLLAFLLSSVIMQPFSFSAATLISNNQSNDFDISDFYNIIADSRAVRSVDRDITILDIADATREDLAAVLDALPAYEPAVVGLDVMFDKPHDDDSFLFEAIDNLPQMVMLVDMDADKERNSSTFHLGETSFFHGRLAGYSFGASNLPTKNAGGVVREFRPWYPTSQGDTIPSFAVAVAMKADANAVDVLRSRGRETELINFPSRSFRSVYWEDLPYNADLIRDHILLIGDLNNAADRHATPPRHDMPGIEIHARALSTILSGDYITPIPGVWNYIIAFLLCFLLAFTHLMLPAEFKALALRIVQLVLLYLVIVIGYHYFIDNKIVINFSYTLLMLTFVLFACDIWLGAKGVQKYFKNKEQQAIKERQDKNNHYATDINEE